jgi:hypothetical protein
MVNLLVQQMDVDDIFTDRARLNYTHRRGFHAGTVCKVATGNRWSFVEVRNYARTGVICMDDETRRRLGVSSNERHEFSISRAGFIGELIWIARASNPMNRVAAKLGVLSFCLGVLSLALAIPPFIDWLHTHGILF